MDANPVQAGMTQAAEIALARATQVAEFIARLDACAASIKDHADLIGDEVYGDLVGQAYQYATFLTECKEMNMSLKDPRIREVTNEITLFCEFIEEELGM